MLGSNILAFLPDLRILRGLGVHVVFSDDVIFNRELILYGGKLFGCQHSGHGVVLQLQLFAPHSP